MAGDEDCLCGGSGVIYDWSICGDPCPECKGRRFRASSQIKMAADRASNKGCAIVLLVSLAIIGGLARAAGYYF